MKYKSFSTTSSKVTSSGVLYDMDVIMENVLNLLLTRKGDYPMDINKGCIIHNYVFHPTLNSDEKSEIIEDTTTQLQSDPRLSNIMVDLEVMNEDIIVAIYADVVGLDNPMLMNITLKELAQYG
jgi:phage baseplate assembly protein W